MLKSTIMTTTLEAIYENGVFRPVSEIPENLKEHERVKIVIETKTDEGKVTTEILRELLTEGLISHIPEGITNEDDDFEPIKIKGKPFSETLLEDRN